MLTNARPIEPTAIWYDIPYPASAYKMVIWDPDKCAINDEVRIDDYLGKI